MRPKQIAPSMMCVDLIRFGETLRALEQVHADYLHIDVMDGVFVPNYACGTHEIRQLRAATEIPLDLHLMIERPDLKLDRFAFQAGDLVSIHAEATPHIQRTLHAIRERGAHPILALNPGTPLCVVEEILPDVDAILLMTVNPGYAGQALIPQTIDKIRRLRALLDSRGVSIPIEVDGCVSFPNARLMSEAGADIFVAGTASLFDGKNTLTDNFARLREAIKI